MAPRARVSLSAKKQIGKLAVEQLLKIKKDKKNKPVKTLITGNLIIRDSIAKKA